jgi:hypothetical protein
LLISKEERQRERAFFKTLTKKQKLEYTIQKTREVEQAAETQLASIAPPRAENDVASVGGDAMEEC